MRKSFFGLLAVALMGVFAGCSKQEAKKITGIVKNVGMDKDTLKTLTLITGEDSMVFSLDGVRFNNGMMLPHDSVAVYYADGENDTARAFIVSVIPKPAVTINPEDNKDKELITAPN